MSTIVSAISPRRRAEYASASRVTRHAKAPARSSAFTQRLDARPGVVDPLGLLEGRGVELGLGAVLAGLPVEGEVQVLALGPSRA